ncbi:RhoGEF domain [Carpediemonas membranifera]|uniref:RhoGEF domain n=1 Tax=Carpediemonas membranifera TaxID=201153 RepID=A0A8J6B277_9EUKA|nr:RhoGEF domain [Carpediemonas membranifera]|eukprot:KAG9392689.1 RhoGEF domain [Carpediemonas membranifera]
MARGRATVVEEIHKTEENYVMYLDAIVNKYKKAVEDAMATDPAMMPTEDFEIIFRGVENIYQLNSIFLDDIKTVMAQDGVEFIGLGKTFARFAKTLTIYKSYLAKYDNASDRLRKAEARSSKLASLLEASRADMGGFGQNIHSLLIMPVQRVPRYALLLEDMVRATVEGHPDYPDLKVALDEIKKVAKSINEAIRDQENRDKLRDIQYHMQGCPELVAPSRRYVYEGTLTKQCRKKRKARHIFLLSDSIVYATELGTGLGATFKFHMQLPLQGAQVQTSADDPTAILILTEKKSIQLFGPDQLSTETWVQHIEATIAALPKTDARGLAPVWQSDKEKDCCPSCGRKFTLTFRRHHCRSCGALACKTCSRGRVVLEHLSDKPQRVCMDCFKRMAPEEAAAQETEAAAGTPSLSLDAPPPPPSRPIPDDDSDTASVVSTPSSFTRERALQDHARKPAPPIPSKLTPGPPPPPPKPAIATPVGKAPPVPPKPTTPLVRDSPPPPPKKPETPVNQPAPHKVQAETPSQPEHSAGLADACQVDSETETDTGSESESDEEPPRRATPFIHDSLPRRTPVMSATMRPAQMKSLLAMSSSSATLRPSHSGRPALLLTPQTGSPATPPNQAVADRLMALRSRTQRLTGEQSPPSNDEARELEMKLKRNSGIDGISSVQARIAAWKTQIGEGK